MKYYIHAYADRKKCLPDKEDIIEAANDETAYATAWKKYPEYEEIYVERASPELLQEFGSDKSE